MTKQQREVVQTFANVYNLSDRFWRNQAKALWAGTQKPILPFDHDMLALKGQISEADLKSVKCDKSCET